MSGTRDFPKREFRSRQDGSWSLLDDIQNLVIPDDLSNALHGNKTAQKEFDAFTRSGPLLSISPD